MRKFGFTGLIRLILIVLTAAVGFAGWSSAVALAQAPPPPRSDPPPHPPGGPPDRTQPSGVSGDSQHGGGAVGFYGGDCATVFGVVINWGYRNEPKLPITLGGFGWQTQRITDDNGYYASDCLGAGAALLNPVSAPWQHPLTTDVAVRLGGRRAFEVNLGVYGGDITPTLEITPVMRAYPAQARPGATVTYTIELINTLANRQPMGQVMLTDLLPLALTPLTTTATVGAIEWWGNLLTVELGELPPGQSATVTVVAGVAGDAPPVITNRASAVYTGHVVAQTAPVEVTVQK